MEPCLAKHFVGVGAQLRELQVDVVHGLLGDPGKHLHHHASLPAQFAEEAGCFCYPSCERLSILGSAAHCATISGAAVLMSERDRSQIIMRSSTPHPQWMSLC